MIVRTPFYVISTKVTPIMFLSDEHSEVEELDDAAWYRDREEAENIIKTYDEPDNFMVLQGIAGVRL